MNRTTTAFLAGAALVAVLFVARDGARAESKSPRAAWEHHCFFAANKLTDKANVLGKKGWELVAVSVTMPTSITEKQLLCFKRPL
jgi:hypothetical protein